LGAVGRAQSKGSGKVFFSEEKNQKTFAIDPAAAATATDKSLLVLFFRKEHS
jgi:hypothetical protein